MCGTGVVSGWEENWVGYGKVGGAMRGETGGSLEAGGEKEVRVVLITIIMIIILSNCR